MKNILCLLTAAALLLATQFAYADSATWNLSPTNSSWNNAANWTPATVPNGANDTATFDASSITSISLSSGVEVDSIVFGSDASAYTISTGLSSILTISGAGVINNSGLTQNFALPGLDDARMIIFSNGATAGSNTVFSSDGFNSTTGANIEFLDTSRAGEGTFNNLGSIYFFDNSTADHATFINSASVGRGVSPAFTYFGNPGSGRAEGATFINNGATIAGTYGGQTDFYSHGSLGHSTVIANGATVQGGHGGNADIGIGFHADSATLIANGGTNGGGGGSITFINRADGGMSRVQVFGNGYLDLRYPQGFPRLTTIGSLEGDGLVYLGGNQLSVGSNNRDTEFAGTLVENGSQGDTSGSLGKVGGGRLVLKRPGKYSGGTVVLGGDLAINNTTGSGTGTGPVVDKAGTLSGGGIIGGSVTVGTGNGAGANLAPGKAQDSIGTLTIQGALTVNSDATYSFGLKSDTPIADEVVANGVTIASGAQFSMADAGASTISLGTVFTAVNNNGVTPIAGAFANLADGSTITVGPNTFLANYEGGDGNDLTLTVVQ